ncbi:hypothetical protein PRZ48_000110 [Zasmidium cellare]|uniref:Zn(2)-C6 fungal-type domain-containing protein n=1 Tax=Zasmidium cellare TaxID=395010 RepID=A0ABR0EYU2_ZASCE|nr:hypothetical protein PRZ48_000110 [Zasmidium cellare]
MPNYGRSGRCLTCKRRRVKCDEARPSCSPCRRLKVTCEGYAKSYAFKEQNYKFTSREAVKEDRQVALFQPAGEPSRSLLVGADVAVPFYLLHYASMGRSLAIGRGFYEVMIPAYNSEPSNSPLSLAISAVATGIYSFWRHQDAVKQQAQAPHHVQAVAALRSALERPEERARPATALAVLVLHLYESIHAVYSARSAEPVHHHGALSLLPTALSLDGLDGLIGAYVKGFVVHTEISSALRQKRSIHPAASSYVTKLQTSSLVPENFSSTLDSIGAPVAELQADFVRRMVAKLPFDIALEEQCRGWVTQAEQIEDLLQTWARDVPESWHPLRLTSGQDLDPSIPTYQSACDIYPSCQIATLWNLWRFHRLLLLKITAGASQRISSSSARHIQDLVDGICYSIPFYLGNRTKQSSLSDFADPEILLPSYHSLPPGDARRCHTALSKDEHHRHIVAYGAWHILSPLTNLLTLVKDEHGGRFVAGCLRAGQLEWIRGQLLRIGILVRLPAAMHSSDEIGGLAGYGKAEDLARQVRNGARFMSGP